MKIEKLNDHQIRCTLTGEDLAERHLKISELAYGSEKTRELFQDMMLQANVDFGFEAEDIPLMIEAIPLSAEKIVLIITKVDSPDELDVRFSNFTHSEEEDAGEDEEDAVPDTPQAHDLLHMLERLRDELIEHGENAAEEPEEDSSKDLPRMFTFADIEDAIAASRAVAAVYQGESSLYRDAVRREYHLFLHQEPHSALEFNRVLHMMDSYLEKDKCVTGSEAYCREHCRVILSGNAVQTLSQLS